MAKYFNLFVFSFCVSAICISFNGNVVIAHQDYSNTTVKNDTGKPLNINSISDPEGNIIAEVYMTGNEMKFDNQQRPISGEGYIQASPGKYFHIIFLITCDEKKAGKNRRRQIQIGVNKIEWDKQGNTIDIRGLEPIIKSSLGEELKIVSGLERPKLKDGKLIISIADKGNVPFVIKFEDDGNIPKEQQCKLF